MEKTVFKIRRSFLLPLGLVVLLALTLLISCIVMQLPVAKILILGFLLVPTIILFAESSCRQVRLQRDGVQVKKLFRSKQIRYSDLTSIDTVRVRKRAFVSLSSEEDFIILSNSYDHFDELLRRLLEKVSAEVVSDETRQLAENPPTKSSDVFSAWLAVVVLVLILYVQLGGAF